MELKKNDCENGALLKEKVWFNTEKSTLNFLLKKKVKIRSKIPYVIPCKV